MNLRTMKGWVLATVGGLYIIATGVLLLMNLGRHVGLKLFWREMGEFSVAALMVIAAIGGVIFTWMMHALVSGIRNISGGRKQQIDDKVRREASKR